MSKKSFSISEDFLTPSVSEEKQTPIKITGGGKRVTEQKVTIVRKEPEPTEPVQIEIVRADPDTTGESFTPPEGYKLVPTESKTARLQLLITPTTKEQLKRRSEAEGRSVNDICNQAIADYLSRQ